MSQHNEAWLLRADTKVSRIMHQRFVRLYSDRLEFYRGADDAAAPEWAVPLLGCTTTALETDTFDVKPPGVTWTKGYFTGKMQSTRMMCLTLSVKHRKPGPDLVPVRPSKKAPKRVTLGFESEHEAHEWAASLSQFCDRSDAAPLTSSDVKSEDSSMDDTAEMTDSRAEYLESRASLTPSPVPYGDAAMAMPYNPAGPSTSSPSYDDTAHAPPASRAAAPLAPFQAAKPLPPPHAPGARGPFLPQTAPMDPTQLWESVFHYNGLACYQEPGRAGVYAASCAMKASPLTVFQHFVRLRDGTSAWNVFQDVVVLEHSLDDESLVFKGRLDAHVGAMQTLQALGLVAQRELVLEQLWNVQEEEGVFNLTYRSVDHEGAPEWKPKSAVSAFCNWFRPRRAKVEHVGLTISPLRDDVRARMGHDARHSPECMVTMIMRVDLGGALAHDSSAYRFLEPLRTAWLGAFLSSIVQLRDNLEQQRFADLPPYLATSVVRVRHSEQSHRIGSRQLSVQTAALRADVPVDFAREEAPESWLPHEFYSSPPGHAFNVRGATYLQDHVKIPSPDPVFDLIGMELIQTEEAGVTHLSPYLPLVMHSPARFHLPIHFALPHHGRNLHLVCVFASSWLPGDEGVADTPFTRQLEHFLRGDDSADNERRNQTLKMIPMMDGGSWIARQAIGSTPIIIGRRLETSYHRGDHYLEITVDINSTKKAAKIANVVCGALTSLSILLGFVLEGASPEELPEHLLGTVCLDHLDLDRAKAIDLSMPLLRRSGLQVDDEKERQEEEQIRASAATCAPNFMLPPLQASGDLKPDM